MEMATWESEDAPTSSIYSILCWSGFVIAAASNGVDLGIPLPEGRKICGGLMIGYPAVQYARVPPRKPVRLTVIE